MAANASEEGQGLESEWNAASDEANQIGALELRSGEYSLHPMQRGTNEELITFSKLIKLMRQEA